ncbi:GerAB/ArcD/ProY family transporter [Siminovitchia sediminis]|uniref:GerAB/ArcD/ProY family transporter n=1 Tax=Siminovitchia sediminis TaxID=1274353 RepID=A0ABW4KJV9_9BACI
MIRVEDRKIGTREMFAIIYLGIGINITDATPNLLFDIGSTATWMMPIFSGIAMGVPFLLLLPLLKKYNIGLIEISQQLTGKFLSGILTFVMFASVFVSMVINSRTYVDIVITMYYPNSPTPALMFVFIVVTVLYIARQGLDIISRAGWIFSPIMLSLSILLIILVASALNPSLIFPFAGPGMLPVLKGSIGYSSFFSDVILVCALFSYVRSYESFRTGVLLGFGLSIIKMSVYIAAFIMMFDYSSVENIAFPYHHFTRMAMLTTLANHIEAVFLAAWFMGAAFHFGIYLFVTAFLLGRLIQIKNFERLLLPLAGLTMFLGLLQENLYQEILAREIFLQSISGFFILYPFVLWGVDLVKSRKKKKK